MNKRIDTDTNEKALSEFNRRRTSHLIISVVLDLLGMFTYALPVLGEIGDVVYAPFYGIAILIMYRRKVLPAALGGATGVVEELLPTTDVVPTATLLWIYTYILRKDNTLKSFVKEKNKEIDAMNELKRLE